MDEIASIRPVTPASEPPTTSNVRLTTRDGRTFSFPSEKVQFVRYPDQIWSGTMYTLPLGAWHWTRLDAIKVSNGASTVDVSLDHVQRLALSGSYPSWTIEIEAKSGETLRGTVVPGEVAAQSPGVSSWLPAREGFWFAWDLGHAFLFAPASTISIIEIRP
jgi:hypothetical protein